MLLPFEIVTCLSGKPFLARAAQGARIFTIGGVMYEVKGRKRLINTMGGGVI